MRDLRGVTALVLVAALAACGSPPEDKAAVEPGTATATTAAAAATPGDGPPAVFAQCKACHSVEKGKHGVGPSLFGVFGTRSGELAGYAFSEPMKQAGLVWDEPTLDEYLAAPMKKVPGTKMSYAGLADPARRKELIEYLKTLK